MSNKATFFPDAFNLGAIRGYWTRSLTSSPIIFAIILGFFTVPLVTLFGVLLDQTGIPLLRSETIEVSRPDLIVAFIGGVFIGPPIETALSQLLVIEMIGVTTRTRRVLALWISALAFGILHIFAGGLNRAICLALLGMILSSVYITARRYGAPSAYFATLVVHVTHNFIICALVFFFPEIA